MRTETLLYFLVLVLSMLIAIVGAPNKGKSTFFKACTLSEVETADYPFTTIEPNQGVGFVQAQCPHLDFKGIESCNPNNSPCMEGIRLVPVKLIDVAGLVPGASEGKGLGNKFLDDLRQASAFIQVIDLSGKTDEKGEAVTQGSYNVINDINFLKDEIDKWLYLIVSKVWKSITHLPTKDFVSGLEKQLSGLNIKADQIIKSLLELNLKDKNLREWAENDILKFVSKLREISKPMIIAGNKSDFAVARKNYDDLKSRVKEKIIPCSAESELALREASKKGLVNYIPGDSVFERINPAGLNEEQGEALDFIEENVMKVWGSTGVQQILNTLVYDVLNYIVVYPVEDENKLTNKDGKVLPDAFLMPKGSRVIDLAYAVHSDLGDKFIKAINCRTKQVISKDQELKHGDVIKIRSNA